MENIDCEENVVEIIEEEYQEPKRKIGFIDIFLIQLVICLIVIAVIIIMNLVKPKTAEKIVSQFSDKINSSVNLEEEIADIYNAISKYIDVKI